MHSSEGSLGSGLHMQSKTLVFINFPFVDLCFISTLVNAYSSCKFESSHSIINLIF